MFRSNCKALKCPLKIVKKRECKYPFKMTPVNTHIVSFVASLFKFNPCKVLYLWCNLFSFRVLLYQTSEIWRITKQLPQTSIIHKSQYLSPSASWYSDFSFNTLRHSFSFAVPFLLVFFISSRSFTYWNLMKQTYQ